MEIVKIGEKTWRIAVIRITANVSTVIVKLVI